MELITLSKFIKYKTSCKSLLFSNNEFNSDIEISNILGSLDDISDNWEKLVDIDEDILNIKINLFENDVAKIKCIEKIKEKFSSFSSIFNIDQTFSSDEFNEINSKNKDIIFINPKIQFENIMINPILIYKKSYILTLYMYVLSLKTCLKDLLKIKFYWFILTKYINSNLDIKIKIIKTDSKIAKKMDFNILFTDLCVAKKSKNSKAIYPIYDLLNRKVSKMEGNIVYDYNSKNFWNDILSINTLSHEKIFPDFRYNKNICKNKISNCTYFNSCKNKYLSIDNKFLRYAIKVFKDRKKISDDNLFNNLKEEFNYLTNKEDYSINQDKVSQFISDIDEKSIVWFDFETISTVFCVFKTVPYTQNVFQCSIIRTNYKKNKLLKENHLLIRPSEINLEWYKKVVDSIYLKNAKYVVYSKQFESGILKKTFTNIINDPIYSEKINYIIENIIDFEDLFKIKNDMVKIKQLKGFTSIKYVNKYINGLDELFSNYLKKYNVSFEDYKNLLIGNGLVATTIAKNIFLKRVDIKYWHTIKPYLIKYCRNDVVSMIVIYIWIKFIIKNKK